MDEASKKHTELDIAFPIESPLDGIFDIWLEINQYLGTIWSIQVGLMFK